MSLRDVLLVTCAVVATTTAARSQTNTNAPMPAPAALFAAPAAGAAAAPARPAPTSPARSFVLSPVGAAAAAATSDATPTPPKIDVSALYYFASQNDLGRVAAEIRLIRAKNPDWQPPEDLFAAAGSSMDEQPLWDLFAKRDLAGLQAKMDAMKQDNPAWQPSSNLTGKLALAEAHDALVTASDAKRWADVITVATGNTMLLSCSDVDALWRTAEALAQTGDETRAVQAYRYVLATCNSPGERLATMQKASVVLQSTDALDALLQMGRQQADGHGEFEQIRLDRFRRKIGDAAASSSAPAPTDAEIAALAATASAPAGQADAQLLGWYNYAHTTYPEAQRWFKAALALEPDPKAAEGLVLAFREGGNRNEARKAALQYAGLDPVNRKLMVELLSAGLTDPTATPLTDDEMTTFATAVDEFKSQEGAEALRWSADKKNDKAGAKIWSQKLIDWKGDEIDTMKSAEAAEALGWQLYQSNDISGAETWFQKSADWGANEPAAIGLVMTARRLHHDRDYAARIAQYRALYPHIAEMEAAMRSRVMPSRPVKVAVRQHAPAASDWDRSADDIVNLFKSGKYDDTVAMLEQRRAKRPEPHGLSVIRGWAMYQKGDWDGARRVFSELDGGRDSPERAQGLRTIDEGYTNPRYR